ncbi:hypothetical protein AX774_g6068 [Zancudomyces culisetae]|uniref:Uncharacterized protein n=1 Tax=Zancudomyces culisetae TaxID=1213189 RepID=A0A1R1PHM7_ZANCU|nr:hypothetical protein AX774_g6068 [Zancudomyces culisetae]|eukprot:OMH80495.1 hypothetical protein AX774_g6068 [Zancudomyces culisetae]
MIFNCTACLLLITCLDTVTSVLVPERESNLEPFNEARAGTRDQASDNVKTAIENLGVLVQAFKAVIKKKETFKDIFNSYSNFTTSRRSHSYLGNEKWIVLALQVEDAVDVGFVYSMINGLQKLLSNVENVSDMQVDQFRPFVEVIAISAKAYTLELVADRLVSKIHESITAPERNGIYDANFRDYLKNIRAELFAANEKVELAQAELKKIKQKLHRGTDIDNLVPFFFTENIPHRLKKLAVGLETVRIKLSQYIIYINDLMDARLETAKEIGDYVYVSEVESQISMTLRHSTKIEEEINSFYTSLRVYFNHSDVSKSRLVKGVILDKVSELFAQGYLVSVVKERLSQLKIDIQFRLQSGIDMYKDRVLELDRQLEKVTLKSEFVNKKLSYITRYVDIIVKFKEVTGKFTEEVERPIHFSALSSEDIDLLSKGFKRFLQKFVTDIKSISERMAIYDTFNEAEYLVSDNESVEYTKMLQFIRRYCERILKINYLG